MTGSKRTVNLRETAQHQEGTASERLWSATTTEECFWNCWFLRETLWSALLGGILFFQLFFPKASSVPFYIFRRKRNSRMQERSDEWSQQRRENNENYTVRLHSASRLLSSSRLTPTSSDSTRPSSFLFVTQPSASTSNRKQQALRPRFDYDF